MGYTLTPNMIARVKNELNLIHDAIIVRNQDKIILQSRTPDTLYYRLHEALRAAEHLRFPRIETLRRKVKVKNLGNGQIQISKFINQEATKLVLEEPQDQFGVIESILKHKDSEIEYDLLFPHVSKTPEVLSDILEYCNNSGFEMSEMDNGIEVRRIRV